MDRSGATGDGGPARRREQPLPATVYRDVFHVTPAALAITDLDGLLLDATDLFVERLGWPRLPEGLRLVDLAPPLTWARELLRRGAAPGEPQQGTLVRPADQAELVCTVRLLLDATSTPGWFLLHLPGATGTVATLDPLTGLPNRSLLLDRLEQALARRRRTGGAVEVVVLDLDGFKQVNDRHGHLAGDTVLGEVAHRLTSLVRPSDTVARWGGDEFIVLLESPAALDGALVCRRVEAALQRPVPTDGEAVTVQASCGWVAARPDEGARDVLHRADLEMYRVKRARRGQPGP